MNGQFDLGSVSVTRYFAFVAIVCGLLFALIDDLPPTLIAGLLHLCQWQLQTLLPMFLLYAMQANLARAHSFEKLNPWAQLMLSAMLASLIFVPAALAIDVAVGKERFTWYELLDEYVAVAPPVVVCWLAINTPWIIGFRLVREPQLKQTTSASNESPAFYALLPPDMRGELVYMAAELHYLAVMTTNGKSLILYNLRDAISELPGTIGIQTHRSYWVALAHVRDLKRVNRQGELHMSNGNRVPVSRRNFGSVEKACTAYKSVRDELQLL